MKVLPFTIPVPHDHTIIVQDEVLPYFYTHLHRHEEIQLTWVVDGEGTLIAGNNIQNFRTGDIFWLGTNQPHVFKSSPDYFELSSDKKIHAITIFFNPFGKLKALFDLPEMKSVAIFLQQSNNGFKVSSLMAQEAAVLVSGVHKAQGVEQLLCFIHLLKFFSKGDQLEPFAVNTDQQLITDSEGVRIGMIYDYIVQNAAKPLTLEEIASQAHMTKHAFCRYFKTHTRHTFINFLNKIRVNEACKMLSNRGQASIAQIAYSCGFSSINNFNRVFKMLTGTTPRSYIKQYEGL